MGVMRAGNFASQPKRPVALVASAVWTAAILMCGLLVWVFMQATTLRAERDQFVEHRARLTEEVAGFETLAADAPTAADITNLAERAAFFNVLTGPRAMPLMEILGFLEEALPQDVRISQLVYDAESGRLSLALQAFDEADLPPALRLLEASDNLQDVILERQLRLQQGTRSLVQYDIKAHAP